MRNGEGGPTITAIITYSSLNGLRIARQRDGVFTWIHADHLSSATRITDATGLEVRRLAYAAFGEEAENQGTGDDPKYTYTGKEQDSTGLYYYGARYYDPALSRFISADTVYDAGPQGLNRYSYALNNPILYNDPSGNVGNPFEVMFRGWHKAPPLFKKAVGKNIRAETRGIVHGAKTVASSALPPEGTGMVEGAIPIWGDGKDAYLAIKQGRPGWAVVYIAMAASDIVDFGFGPDDVVKAGAKGGTKVGKEILEETTGEIGERALKEGGGFVDEGVQGASKKARNTTPSPALEGSPYHPDTVAERVSEARKYYGGKGIPGQDLPGKGDNWIKLRGDQGWKDADGYIWKKDQLHKDHWNIMDSKGNKIREVDFEGNQIWPGGPKNKNK